MCIIFFLYSKRSHTHFLLFVSSYTKYLIGQLWVKLVLTCNLFREARRARDFGPGISVFTHGEHGSWTYELHKRRKFDAVTKCDIRLHDSILCILLFTHQYVQVYFLIRLGSCSTNLSRKAFKILGSRFKTKTPDTKKKSMAANYQNEPNTSLYFNDSYHNEKFPNCMMFS